MQLLSRNLIGFCVCKIGHRLGRWIKKVREEKMRLNVNNALRNGGCDVRKRGESSVTRRLDYWFNFGPFTATTICPMTNKTNVAKF